MKLNKRYKCDYCERDYKHKHHLTYHLKKCKNNPNNISISNIDNNGIDNLIKKLSRLKRDNLSQNNKKIPERHECPFCKMSYKQKSHMTRHIRYRCKVFNTESDNIEEIISSEEENIKINGIDLSHDKNVGKKSYNTGINVGKKSVNVGKKTVNVGKKPVNVGNKNYLSDNNVIKYDDLHENDSIAVKNYKCSECDKTFKMKKYLDEHLKKYCKMNISFNNIYSFVNSTFGKKLYGSNGGDIYILQTDFNFNNIFKIGKTTNLYKRLKDYRCGSVLEPRLHYYYPFKNIKKADNLLKKVLDKYNVKREIYECDLKKIRLEILNLQKTLDDTQKEFEPEIKKTDLSECIFCEEIFSTKQKMFDHLNVCKDYQYTFDCKIESENNFFCKLCNKVFKKKKYLKLHNDIYCKKNSINKNNIYKFNKSTFGKSLYGSNGGDIYIIQINDNFDDIYLVGKTTNIYNNLSRLRSKYEIEPRLYYYYPFKNREESFIEIRKDLNIYIFCDFIKCDLDVIRKIILNNQKKLDNTNMEYKPNIKFNNLCKCKHCSLTFDDNIKIFSHLKKCNFYRNFYCNEKEHNIDLELEFNDSDDEDVEKLLEKVKAAEKRLEVETLKKKLEEAEKQIDKLKMSQHVTYNNNITVIAYNKQPNMNHLKDSDFLKIMNRGFKSVPKLIEAVHFNPNKPENHNVYIPNIKNNYAKTWNGNKWNLHNQEELIEDMYDDNSNKLLEKLEEMEESNVNLKDSILKKFKRFADLKDDNDIKKKIKEEIKLILYNHKSIVNNENK